VSAMGGVHGQWACEGDVSNDVGGRVTSCTRRQQGAGKGEGSSGERGFEREVSRGAAVRVLGFGAAWAKALWAWTRFRRDGEGFQGGLRGLGSGQGGAEGCGGA
jgi:hypothetical protein